MNTEVPNSANPSLPAQPGASPSSPSFTILDAGPGPQVTIRVPVERVSVAELHARQAAEKAQAAASQTPSNNPPQVTPQVTPQVAPQVAPQVTPATAASLDPATLPDDPALLKLLVLELQKLLHASHHKSEALQQKVDALLHRLYGSKSEKFDPNQPWLIPEMAPNASEPEPPPLPPAEPKDANKPKRKGHGRNALPANLRRETHRYELPEN